MVAWEGQYYGALFKGYHGVTQGDPILPTILNLVVDEVIRHWVKVVAGEEAETEEFGRSLYQKAVVLYADEGIFPSP